jgi:hypothetical protein
MSKMRRTAVSGRAFILCSITNHEKRSSNDFSKAKSKMSMTQKSCDFPVEPESKLMRHLRTRLKKIGTSLFKSSISQSASSKASCTRGIIQKCITRRNQIISPRRGLNYNGVTPSVNTLLYGLSFGS